MGHAATSRCVSPQRAGGEQQVDATFCPDAPPTALPSTPVPQLLPHWVEGVIILLRLQLEAQGGVDGDDAAAGGNSELDDL